jgi:valyl-tRNA synthetase
VRKWPLANQSAVNDEAEAQMSILIDIIRTIRNIRSEYNVEPAKKVTAHIAAGSHYDLVAKHQEMIIVLARLEKEGFHLASTLPQKPDQSVSQVISGGIEIYLPLAGLMDLEAERDRLHKEVAQVEKRIAASKVKLNNPDFMQKAPPVVVEKEQAQLADLELQAAKIWERLKELG